VPVIGVSAGVRDETGIVAMMRAAGGTGCGEPGRVPCGMTIALAALRRRPGPEPSERTSPRGGIRATTVTNSTVSDGASGADGGARFEEARRVEALGRLRRATLVLLPPLTLALAVNLRVFGDGMPVRVLALLGMLGLAALTHVAVAQRAAGRRAIPIAVAFVMALGILLTGLFVEPAGGRDVHMGTISALMMGAAIVIPWGVGPQLAVGVMLACAYAFLPGWDAASGGQTVDFAFSLVDCVALSAVGAYVLDRQRRVAFAEREQALATTAQRELLLDASRELNGSLDLAETATTIARAAHALVGGDTVALVAVDERRGVLRTLAVAGAPRDVDREILNVEVPANALSSLLEQLATDGWATTASGELAGLAELIREQFGVTESLYVAVARKGELLAYLTFNYRAPDGHFTEEQRRLAEGFAPQCAIALANARLVGDLQSANRVKTEFVSTMSHELRTPLSVMLGYVDVLADAVRDEQSRIVLDRMRIAGQDLLELVQATLDLNRLESGQDPACLEAVSMHELWDELAMQFSAIRPRDGVALRWEAQGMPVAFTDRRKVKIVVKNLVGNALKFTPAGEVTAAVRLSGGRCVVVVRDTGIGIPPEHLPGIFEMFRQVDNSDRRSHGGVGLGLYIVRQLAEQLGATLDVASTVGRGTTFTLSLPTVSAERLGAAAAA
jgi:signal transduction histidine kinase